MQNNKTIPEPLMFIHTVSTPITVNSSKNYFDSREKKARINNLELTKKDKVDLLLLKKIQNIIQMYKQGTGVNCLVQTIHNESIEGVPYNIENEFLLVNQNEQIITIALKDIFDVIILKL